ncbi:MAG: ELM1/GtrOC1 family putative glycosyltransferase, partial [Pseudomonadota bacterium]
ASAFIATNDSFAMMSEAVFTGKPLYGWRLPGGKAKFERFYRGLEAHGALRWFDGSLERWNYPPLDAAATIADALAPKLGLASVAKERI